MLHLAKNALAKNGSTHAWQQDAINTEAAASPCQNLQRLTASCLAIPASQLEHPSFGRAVKRQAAQQCCWMIQLGVAKVLHCKLPDCG